MSDDEMKCYWLPDDFDEPKIFRVAADGAIYWARLPEPTMAALRIALADCDDESEPDDAVFELLSEAEQRAMFIVDDDDERISLYDFARLPIYAGTTAKVLACSEWS